MQRIARILLSGAIGAIVCAILSFLTSFLIRHITGIAAYVTGKCVKLLLNNDLMAFRIVLRGEVAQIDGY